MDSSIEVRRFESPDSALDMKEQGGIDIVTMADGTTGMRATFEPGWTWEKDEKPLLGSPELLPHAPYRLLHCGHTGRPDGRHGERDVHRTWRLLRNPPRPRRLCLRIGAGSDDPVRGAGEPDRRSLALKGAGSSENQRYQASCRNGRQHPSPGKLSLRNPVNARQRRQVQCRCPRPHAERHQHAGPRREDHPRAQGPKRHTR